jgi:hypothetical protein
VITATRFSSAVVSRQNTTSGRLEAVKIVAIDPKRGWNWSMASQMGDPTVFDLLFVVLLLSATGSILLLCRYLNTRGERDGQTHPVRELTESPR